MDLMLPGDELEFYRKDILDLTQKETEAITNKREYIEDWIGISETFIFHMITYYDTENRSCGTLNSLFIDCPSRCIHNLIIKRKMMQLTCNTNMLHFQDGRQRHLGF